MFFFYHIHRILLLLLRQMIFTFSGPYKNSLDGLNYLFKII